MAETPHPTRSRPSYQRPCPRCRRMLASSEFPIVTKASGRQGPGALCRECSVRKAADHAVYRAAFGTDDHRYRKYGMTRADYEAMYASQGGCCAICAETIALDDDPNVHIDHDHATGAVRGVLCRGCNLGLGNFRDDITRLEGAIAYLAARKGVQRG